MLSGDDLSVGETLTVLVSAFDRVTKLPVSDAVCTVDFFAPPKDPEHNPADRTADHTFTATFDSGQNAYTIDVDTTGWAAGQWTYRGKLVSTKTGFEYGTFVLLA